MLNPRRVKLSEDAEADFVVWTACKYSEHDVNGVDDVGGTVASS